MARGGSRQGAGRKPLHLVVRSKETAQKAFDRSDKMPLDIMLDMINGRMPYDRDMMQLCQAAAPYLHPKLATIEQVGADGGPIETKGHIDVRFVSAQTEVDDDGGDHASGEDA
jgi:hypothetical protein